MTLKKILFQQGRRQVEVAKALQWCPSAFNKFLNGWIQLPDRYREKLCSELSLNSDELELLIANQ